MKKIPKPVALIILDGFGIAPTSDGNGVALAKTPNFNKFIESYPVMTLLASGEAVGLSWGEVGNSEVGHLNLGAGRIFYQNLPRIDKAIDDESFFENKVLLAAAEHVKKNKSQLHLIGLIGEGKVHSASRHCFALLEFAKKQKLADVFVHAILDGRDTKFNSGEGFVEELEKKMKELGVGQIASLSGRMFAMDRDNRWERVEKSYQAMAMGKSEEYYASAEESIEISYKNQVFDEEFVPAVIGKEGSALGKISDKDAVVFFNYRADRARELSLAFVSPDFDKFNRGEILHDLFFVTMTEYGENIPARAIFEREEVQTTLPKIISEKGYRQLHIAETEKYAHVTFFFSGGVEDPYEGEERIVIPSPRVASYAEKPEMSAAKLTDSLVKEIIKEKHDFIVVNFANPDMVGHTGQVEATVKSIEYVDKCLGQVIEAILAKGGQAIVVADHGNAEELVNLQTGEKDKEHSTNPVPCIFIGAEFEGKSSEEVTMVGNDLSLVQPTGLLSDVAPTILKMMNISPPEHMTGRPLI